MWNLIRASLVRQSEKGRTRVRKLLDLEDLGAQLDRLKYRVNHFRVPVIFAHMLYGLRIHIALVRARIAKL
jgi:hypothetical protein